MPLKMSRRVSFSPDDNDKPTNYPNKHVFGENKKRVIGIWGFRLPKDAGFSPVKFLRCIGAEVARALRFVSGGQKCSRKVSSANLARSCSYSSQTLDSQRTEAIEDCIEFLNSSSSFQRSNSVSSSC